MTSSVEDCPKRVFHLLAGLQGDPSGTPELAVYQVGDDALMEAILRGPGVDAFTHVNEHVGYQLLPLFFIHAGT